MAKHISKGGTWFPEGSLDGMNEAQIDELIYQRTIATQPKKVKKEVKTDKKVIVAKLFKKKITKKK